MAVGRSGGWIERRISSGAHRVHGDNTCERSFYKSQEHIQLVFIVVVIHRGDMIMFVVVVASMLATIRIVIVPEGVEEDCESGVSVTRAVIDGIEGGRGEDYFR